MRALSLLLAFFMVVAFAAPTFAQSDVNRTAADKLVQDGLLLARTKKFREAIKKFEDAFKLYPHPEIQHNLARAHEELGELVKAYDYFSQALKSDYTFAAQGRERLTKLDVELRKTHARITVRATPSQSRVVLSYPDGTEDARTTTPFAAWAPAGKTRLVATNPSFKTTELALDLVAGEDKEVNVTLSPVPRQGFLQVTVNLVGATVSLAGQPIGTSPLDSLAFEAGIYELEVTLSGYKPYRESVVVVGDQVSSVNVILVPLETSRPPEISSGPTTWPGWLLVGLGAAAGGTALYLQLGEAVPLANEANDLGPGDANDAEYDRLIAKAKDYQTAAIISGITGGVLAATGVVLLITADDDPSESRAFAPSFGLSPAGAYVGGTLRF